MYFRKSAYYNTTCVPLIIYPLYTTNISLDK
jgi:hypothetical protein